MFIVGITPTKEAEITATAEVKTTDECVVIAFPMFWILFVSFSISFNCSLLLEILGLCLIRLISISFSNDSLILKSFE